MIIITCFTFINKRKIMRERLTIIFFHKILVVPNQCCFLKNLKFFIINLSMNQTPKKEERFKKQTSLFLMHAGLSRYFF